MNSLIPTSKLVVFVSNSEYEPAKQLVSLLKSLPNFEVNVLKPSQTVKDAVTDCAVAVIFITIEELSKVKDLTSYLLELASEIGVKRLAWVAPALGQSSDLGKRLAEAEALVRSKKLETLVLRHAPLFSSLFDQKKELQFRRTLSLPLGNKALPWLAPSVISSGLYKWIKGEVNNQPPSVLIGAEQLSGEEIAKKLSQVLQENLNARKFAELRFSTIDTDQSGKIDKEELFPYLLELGYSVDEAEQILQAADKDKSGSIDFNEFILGLEEYLNKVLSDVPTEVQYFNVSKSAALYDLMHAGINENAARAKLETLAAFTETQDFASLNSQELVQWLGHTGPTFAEWAQQYILDFINVFILPGRGILTINEGMFEGRPALITRLVQGSNRQLVGQRSLDVKAVEIEWVDEDNSNAEVISYQSEGSERTLKVKDGCLVGLSVRGSWPGLRIASKLFFQEEPIPRWQLSLFRELGELQMEDVSTIGAADEVICNCTKATCGKLQELINNGNDTIDKIGDLTQVTRICGGCQALVEELLGSSSLFVAELVKSENLNRNLTRLEFRPVGKDVVASKPGQHILIQGRIDHRWVTRAYTLSSPAYQTNTYEITVKREELGLFSRWLCDRASGESLLRISDPRGEFILEDENSVVFFAGGIGVTPAIAMMRTLALQNDARKFHLDYSAPEPQDFVFEKELQKISAQYPNLTYTLRATKKGGRLTPDTVKDLYPYNEGTVAFMCGPTGYMDAVRSYLTQAGWRNDAIKEELFSSKLDDEGKAKPPVVKKQVIQVAGGICPVEHHSFDVGPVGSVMEEAEAFLKQCYLEQGLNAVFLPRWQEVKASIEQTGTYEHTYDELVYGARLAWRNSSRCVGRYFWQSLHVRDMRHLETEEEMFQATLEHIKYATNNGDLRATMTVFKADGRKLWNVQLLRYAGYRQPDGTILGDPGNVHFTEEVLKLGWSHSPQTPFDYLPLVIQLPGKQPKFFEIPPSLILDVPLSHPRYEWFEKLGLKWYALPAVSNMVFDIGGIQYECAPFNGFYMGTEIGGRNYSDTYRYNMLPIIADKMGLDTSDDSTLWKDSALVELNIAVVYSYKKHNVRLLDHHAMSDYFIKFLDEEKASGRPVYSDWGWIIPPVSGSTSKAYGIEMENRILKPNYFYAPEPWKTTTKDQGCPFHK